MKRKPKKPKGNPVYRQFILQSIQGGVFRTVKPVKGLRPIKQGGNPTMERCDSLCTKGRKITLRTHFHTGGKWSWSCEGFSELGEHLPLALTAGHGDTEEDAARQAADLMFAKLFRSDKARSGRTGANGF